MIWELGRWGLDETDFARVDLGVAEGVVVGTHLDGGGMRSLGLVKLRVGWLSWSSMFVAARELMPRLGLWAG